jgi:pilus assembly protein CpaE
VSSDAAYLRNAPCHEDSAAHKPAAPAISSRPIPCINIQVFCEDQNTARVIQRVSEDRRLAKSKVTVQMGGVEAAVVFSRNLSTPNLIIVESGLNGNALLAGLDRLAEVCDQGTKVIVVGHVNDVSLYRELLHRGVSEYVVAPTSVTQVIEAIASVYTDTEAGSLGQVIAFVGSKGGVGSSTVCHNTAFIIASTLESDVVIADLDLPFGTAGLDFNQDPIRGMADALSAPERLDGVLLDRLLSRCADHLSLLAAPTALDRPYDVDTNACDTVLDAVREKVPWVAVDVPNLWTTWAMKVMLKTDKIVLTATPDLASLRNTKNLVDQLKTARPDDPPPVLVLNQVGLPKRPEISVKDFAEAVELDPEIIIDFDAQLFGAAANNGQMIEEVSPNSRAAEAFRALGNRLSDRSEQNSGRQSLLAPILGRLRLIKEHA